MDLNYSQDESAFRDEVRGWIKQNLPQDLREKIANYDELGREDLLRWHKILAKRGWVAPAWPKEFGGTDWNVVQRYIFEEECGFAATPPLVAFSLRMCAPVLLRFGTDAQKQKFLPRIYKGEDFWCQGYSEPGSGSDLASLKTKAVKQDGHYVVTGQKIWTTLAHYADWIFCLVRTDGSKEKRQDGISFLLIDMKTPGVTVRPIRLLDGSYEVNEVWFEDVEVPLENRIGEENSGWTCAKFLLGHERTNIAGVGASKRELLRLKRIAAQERKDGRPLIEDPAFAAKIAEVEIELMALEITNLRVLAAEAERRAPGPEASLLKIKGSEIQQALAELMMQAVGPYALPLHRKGPAAAGPAYAGPLSAAYLNMRKTSIYSGSNEIQRNIIAQAILGL